MRLSPLNLSGLIARERGELEPEPQAMTRKGSAHEVVLWRCNHCSSTWDDEDEAIECCDEDPAGKPSTDTVCPCCAKPADDLRDATDCCLWKDIDAATRYSLADAVEAGATWADVLIGAQPH